MWPNFFIVGAAKCGTTSLYSELRKHPDVFLPEIKEPHYFARCPPASKPWETHCSGDLSAYQQLYIDSAGRSAIGDASPSYLLDEESASRIHAVRPDAKIIVILRDPVARAHSAYLMNQVGGYEPSSISFKDALRQDIARENKGWGVSRMYVEAGMYCSQVHRYLDLFGSEQVLVLLSEHLKNKPQDLYAGIARHLGITPEPLLASVASDVQNAYRRPRMMAAYRLATSGVGRKVRQLLVPSRLQDRLRSSKLLFGKDKPAIDDESRYLLQEIYDPDISGLEALLGRRLPELRMSWT